MFKVDMSENETNTPLNEQSKGEEGLMSAGFAAEIGVFAAAVLANSELHSRLPFVTEVSRTMLDFLSSVSDNDFIRLIPPQAVTLPVTWAAIKFGENKLVNFFSGDGTSREASEKEIQLLNSVPDVQTQAEDLGMEFKQNESSSAYTKIKRKIFGTGNYPDGKR